MRIASFGALWQKVHNLPVVNCELQSKWVKEIEGWSLEFTQFMPFSEKHNIFISNWELQALVPSDKEFTICQFWTVNCELQSKMKRKLRVRVHSSPHFQKNIMFLFHIENCKLWCSLTKSSHFYSCENWTPVKNELRKLKVGVHSSHSSHHFQKNITFFLQIENCKLWCSLTKQASKQDEKVAYHIHPLSNHHFYKQNEKLSHHIYLFWIFLQTRWKGAPPYFKSWFL